MPTASWTILADEADGAVAAPVMVLAPGPILALHRVGPAALATRRASMLPSRYSA